MPLIEKNNGGASLTNGNAALENGDEEEDLVGLDAPGEKKNTSAVQPEVTVLGF